MSIKELNRRARELKQQRDAILAQRTADADADPSMTPKQRSEYVAHWKQTLAQQFAPKFAELRDDAQAYARTAKERAERHRPAFDPDNAAALVRTEQAWRNVVLPQLEKGRTLRDALRHADTDALIGAQRFAPAWLQANHGRDGLDGARLGYDSTGRRMVGHRSGPDESVVETEVTRRLIEMSGDDAAEALREGLTVDVELEAFGRSIDHYETGQGSGLDIAIGAAMAQQSPLGDEPRKPEQGESASMAGAIGAHYGGDAA